MDLRTIFKNLWLAVTIFCFCGIGYFIASQRYTELLESQEAKHKHEIAAIQADAKREIEHFQREAAEAANEAIKEQVRKSLEEKNEIYAQMAQLQNKFVNNRDLIRRLHDSETNLRARGWLDAASANRELLQCRQLLRESGGLLVEATEVLQQCRVARKGNESK